MSTSVTDSECTTPETSRETTPVPRSTKFDLAVSSTGELNEKLEDPNLLSSFEPCFDIFNVVQTSLDPLVPLRIAEPFCFEINAEDSSYFLKIGYSIDIMPIKSKLKAICYYLCAIQLYNTMSDDQKLGMELGKEFFNAKIRAPRSMLKIISMLGNFKTQHGRVTIAEIEKLTIEWMLSGIKIDPDCRGFGEILDISLEKNREYYGYSSFSQSRKLYTSKLFLKLFGMRFEQPDQEIKSVGIFERNLKLYSKNYQPFLEHNYIMSDNYPCLGGNASQLVHFRFESVFASSLPLTEFELSLGATFFPSKYEYDKNYYFTYSLVDYNPKPASKYALRDLKKR